MSHQLVASWRWFTENPSFDIIKLVEVRRIGDEFLVMSTPLQFVKFLTKTAITAVVFSPTDNCSKGGRKGCGERRRSHRRTTPKQGGPNNEEGSETPPPTGAAS